MNGEIETKEMGDGSKGNETIQPIQRVADSVEAQCKRPTGARRACPTLVSTPGPATPT